MVRERIADDIYVFSSRRYAQVTAGAIITREGIILIDTLFYPDETREIKRFLEGRLKKRVKYVVNTHYHADHTLGTWLFPSALVVGHHRCRELLDTVGRSGLQQIRDQSKEFEQVRIILPDVLFEDGEIDIYLGGKTVRLQHSPGHSPDLISALVVEDNILFASDTVMPVPTMFDDSYEALLQSLERILEMEPTSVVQGHGEVILKGEVRDVIESDIAYLEKIHRVVKDVVDQGLPEAALESISIESCGKSRIPLNGFVTDLHQANLRKLYADMAGERELAFA